MSSAFELFELTRARTGLQVRIAELEKHLDFVLQPAVAVAELQLLRAQLGAADAAIVALTAPPPAEGVLFDLTPEQAAAHVGLDRRQLTRLIDLTAAARRPCVDIAHGTARKHLRFNKSQLETWAKEKPWQASAPTNSAGSSAGESPPPLTLLPESSGPGSARRSPKPARRSTARTRSARSAPASGGFPLTGNPDLDGHL